MMGARGMHKNMPGTTTNKGQVVAENAPGSVADAIILAVTQRDYKCLKALCVPGAPVNVRPLPRVGSKPSCVAARGVTPLMLATQLGDPESVRILLEAGADPSFPCERFAPIHTAAKKGRRAAECLQAMLDHPDCNVNAPSVRTGITPFTVALVWGGAPAAEALFATGRVALTPSDVARIPLEKLSEGEIDMVVRSAKGESAARALRAALALLPPRGSPLP